ncbi:hypothetical protein [Mucilaginibacter sp. SP1R1]|uniref:hypothetical protein n=1 Tax=Mucilaginibacter sp. SP1R1 TaxID=2723091 RepID=UPI00161A907D|nr:hypothetical protein [Mucilaginibacter sp. SP1R1]MBB6149506.1 hypothetical protein [Mucilaginibacter sp. SP1R1]
MKFINELTIDWYDNILKAFCKADNDVIYYCCLLALDKITDQKIYLCVEIKYLMGYQELLRILEKNSFKEHWHELRYLIKIKNQNQSYLIRAKDLRIDEVKLIDYKTNYGWPEEILFGEYPEVLDVAAEVDQWWKYQ